MFSFFRLRLDNEELRKRLAEEEAHDVSQGREMARLNDRIRDGRQENERLKTALKLSNESRCEMRNQIASRDAEIEVLEKQLSDARAEARIRDKKTGRYVTRNGELIKP